MEKTKYYEECKRTKTDTNKTSPIIQGGTITQQDNYNNHPDMHTGIFKENNINLPRHSN